MYERPNISHPRSDICPGTCSARLVNTTNGQVNRLVPALDPGVYTSPKPGTYLRSSLSALSGPAISPLPPPTPMYPAASRVHSQIGRCSLIRRTDNTDVSHSLTHAHDGAPSSVTPPTMYRDQVGHQREVPSSSASVFVIDHLTFERVCARGSFFLFKDTSGR